MPAPHVIPHLPSGLATDYEVITAQLRTLANKIFCYKLFWFCVVYEKKVYFPPCFLTVQRRLNWCWCFVWELKEALLRCWLHNTIDYCLHNSMESAKRIRIRRQCNKSLFFWKKGISQTFFVSWRLEKHVLNIHYR